MHCSRHRSTLLSIGISGIIFMFTISSGLCADAIDLKTLTLVQCKALDLNSIECTEGLTNDQCELYRQSVTNACKNLESPLVKFFSIMHEVISENIAEIILATFGLIAAVIAGIFRNITSKLQERLATLNFSFTSLMSEKEILAARVNDPFFDRPKLGEQYATNLILIGEGGSGKTTLVHALTGSEEAEPDIATAEFKTYTVVNEVNTKTNSRISRRLTRIYIDDYVGQDFTQAVDNQALKQRQNVIDSSTLVVVVDLFYPPSDSLNPLEQQPTFDIERVNEQLGVYNEPVIQILGKLVGSNGQIVLFVNKVDLISSLSPRKIKSIHQAYSRLSTQLQLRGIKFGMIIGSAATGQGVVGYDAGAKRNRSLYKFVVDHAIMLELEKPGTESE